MSRLTALLAVPWLAWGAAAAEPPGPSVAAAEPPPGATTCSGCHPPAAQGAIPTLAGRPAADIVAEMAAFRSGQREATVMGRIAKGFTDEEIRAIAEWLAAQAS